MPRSPHRTPLSAHFLRGALGALLIIAGLGADRANAQSFDCRNARYADERTICQNQGLGQLDQELASAYDRVMRKLPKEERDAFDNNETNSAAALPAPSPTNKRSRHEEPGTTVSAIHGPPSEGEGQAATGNTAVPEKRSRAKETAGSGSAIPNPPSRHEAPGAIAGAAVPDKRSRHKESASTIS